MSEILDMSNSPTTATPIQNAVPSLDSIAEKMTAMRNQAQATKQTETGESEVATNDSPVAPEDNESDSSSVEPEVVTPEDGVVEGNDESEAPEQVSNENSSAQDIIDFVEFATENPNAKFKFMRNGKEMIIDAKQAQAILGQGGAIHEEARQLKIQKAEFDEYLKEQRAQQEGLTLAMEFTVRPQLQKAYDEILKVQQYQQTFQQQLSQTNDPAIVARIRTSMEQNERYITQQSQVIRQLKPNLDQFQQIRKEQVAQVLEQNRKGFTDKELKNEYLYNEIRDKVSKGWQGAKSQLVPGIDNIDLVSSDEHIMSLLRDGLKYREKPSAKSAGSSIAALTKNRSTINTPKSNIESLQEAAKKGDKKAQDNLLVAKLQAMRSRR